MIYPYVSSLFGDEFVIVLYAWFLRIIRAICAPTRYQMYSCTAVDYRYRYYYYM